MAGEQANSQWQGRVRKLLALGYGVEDIAIKTGVSAATVRAEVAILRAEGRLEGVLRGLIAWFLAEIEWKGITNG